MNPEGVFSPRSTSKEMPNASKATNGELERTELVQMYKPHLRLLKQKPLQNDVRELMETLIFTTAAFNHSEILLLNKHQTTFPQYGLLAGLTEILGNETQAAEIPKDPRVFFNIATPSSIFICGSQGSGKSHTLSCLLESCLMTSNASKLPKPLTGLIFHYDTFISDHGGSLCEAAFLSSNPKIKVRVLCAPTNLRTIQLAYHALNVEIEPLEIDENDLNTKRMLDLMAVSKDDGPMPLYLHTVYRILREMRLGQQLTSEPFKYNEFRRQIMEADLSPSQLGPLQQRLDTLESFMVRDQASDYKTKKSRNRPKRKGNDWTLEPGCLTIVDLSCPCVTPEGACSLFNICLSIFLEQQTSCGRVVALDEAHKYMNASAEALTLTNTLLSTIRLQRHLGTRVFISTQEPTISPKLLDLSSVTIVRRFTSPDWRNSLKEHLVGASICYFESSASGDRPDGEHDKTPCKVARKLQIFDKIVKLNVGEALLFAPNAVVRFDEGQTGEQIRNGVRVKRLGAEHLSIRVRMRLTIDGGKSVMAA